MSLLITPVEKTVNGLLTKAIAAKTQIRYVMAREDLAFTVVAAGGAGEIVLTVASTTDFAANDRVFIFDDAGNYTGINTIISLVLDTSITVSGTFGATSTGYINALTGRANYNVQIDIFDDDNGGVKLTSSVLKYVPNQAGLLTVDLSSIIGGLMSDPDNTLFSLQYHLDVTEVWSGSSESPQTTTTIQAILAEEQLLHTGGALMWEALLRESGQTFDHTGSYNTGGDLGIAVDILVGDVRSLFIVGEPVTYNTD